MAATLKRYAGPILGIWVLAEIAASLLLHFQLGTTQGAFVDSILLPFEVMIVVPALIYFFIIRKRGWTPLALLPVSYLGGLIVVQVFKPTDLTYVALFAACMLLVELTIVVHEGIGLIRRFKETRVESDDPFYWFSETLFSVFHSRRLSKIISMELTAMYYALFSWRKRAKSEPGIANFSYHEKSGYSALVGVLIGVSVVEIAVVHLLLSRWSTEVALVVTLLSVYFIFWILGDLRATLLRPVRVEADAVEINSGIRFSARIPAEKIESIATKDPEFNKKKQMNFGMLGNTNCWVIFSEEVEVEGFFGGKRKISAVGLSLDDVAGFRKAIEAFRA